MRRLLAATTLAIALQTAPAVASTDDPLEWLNRSVFGLNLVAYDHVLVPAVRWYRAATTVDERKAIANFTTNLRAPVVIANELLQGDAAGAKAAAARFAINSTLGLLGLFDPATEWGYPRGQPEDFGQTLARYGVPAGPYLVLPLIGPCNARDAVGRAADYLALGSYLDTDMLYALAGTVAVSEAEPTLEQDAVDRKAAIDLYAAARVAYGQRRDFAVRDGAPLPDPDYDGIFTP